MLRSKVDLRAILQDSARTLYLAATAFWSLGIVLSVLVYCLTLQPQGIALFLSIGVCFLPISILMAAYYEGRQNWQVMLVVGGHLSSIALPVLLLCVPFLVLSQFPRNEYMNTFIQNNGYLIFGIAVGLGVSYFFSMGAFACWILYRSRAISH